MGFYSFCQPKSQSACDNIDKITVFIHDPLIPLCADIYEGRTGAAGAGGGGGGSLTRFTHRENRGH